MAEKTFAQELAEALLEKKMTQSDLARCSGVSQDSISAYLKGTQVPYKKTAARIREALRLHTQQQLQNRQRHEYISSCETKLRIMTIDQLRQVEQMLLAFLDWEQLEEEP